MRTKALRVAACLALAALTAWLARPGGPAPVRAQVQLVEKVARVEVPVFEDNLDDAKSRAVAQGQRAALHSLVNDLLAEEWVQLFDKELRQRILGRVDRYVASYRVQRSETGIDRTRYIVVLSAQINRRRLTEDLHALSLPVRGDPPTSLTLLYGRTDPVLREAPLREAIAARLRERLTLLNFLVGQLAAVGPATAEVLGNPLSDAAARVQALAEQPGTTALFLAFERAQAAQGADADVGAKVSAWLYQQATGTLLATFEQQERSEALRLPGRTAGEREQVLDRLAEPLVIQMQPGAIGSLRTAARDAAELRLRVLGFRSVEEQEAFERAFFTRNSPFERFSLYSLAPQAVTYRGPYGGDRSSLERELQGETVGDFRVRRVYWYNEVLELDVARMGGPVHAEMRLFPPEVRPPDVSAQLESYLTRYSNLDVEDPHYAEVEDNGWLTRANRIPFNATIYANADSRSDSDVYVGEALASGETVVLVWHRVGRTNLTPAVRFYDEDGVLMSTFTPRSWLRYEYTVPEGQHRFYVEIGDRFGHLKVDTGGYLSFHYLFKVQREGL